MPPKKKNALGVQRKISNINDELPSVPVVRSSANQPAETKGCAKTRCFTYSLCGAACLYVFLSVHLEFMFQAVLSVN